MKSIDLEMDFKEHQRVRKNLANIRKKVVTVIQTKETVLPSLTNTKNEDTVDLVNKSI